MDERITRRTFLATGALSPLAVPRGANERVRVAVVGVGPLGRDHLMGFAQACNTEIYAVCDLREDRLRHSLALVSQRQRRAAVAVRDYRALLDCKDIDIVTIATPLPSRAMIAAEACRAGKHVFLQGPSGDPAASLRILRVASQHRRMVEVGFRFPNWDPAQVLAGVRSSLAGKVDRVEGLRLCRTADMWDSQGLAVAAIDDLNLARRGLGLASPRRVIALSLGGEFAKSLSMSFDFVREDGGISRIDWEVRGYRCGEESAVATFAGLGRAAEITLYGDGQWDQRARFASVVRQGGSEALANPLEEARIGEILACYATASARCGRMLRIEDELLV